MSFLKRPVLLVLVAAVIACSGVGDTATDGQTLSPTTTTAAATADTSAAPSGPTLTIEGRSFGRAPDVAAGETFTIVNLDSTRHTFSSSDGAWEEVQLPVESEVEFTVPDSLAPGRYIFFCAVHSDMSGSLTVTG
jgi:plastocyanin